MPIEWVSIVLPVGVGALGSSVSYAMAVAQGAKVNMIRLEEFRKQEDIKFDAMRREHELRINSIKEELSQHRSGSQIQDVKRDEEFRDAIEQLRGVASQISSMAREQNVINTVTEKALGGIVNRLEKQGEHITSLATNFSLMKQLLDGLLAQQHHMDS